MSDKGTDWLERPYVVLKESQSAAPYSEGKQKWTPAGNSTFWQVPKDQLSVFEKTLLQPYFGVRLEEIVETKSIEIGPMSIAIGTSGAGPLNRILYGPPGTGKTYRAVAEAVAIIDGRPASTLTSTPAAYAAAKQKFDQYRKGGQIEFVTFHPSFTYQDFVVGIRPSTAGTNVVYSVEPGPLKRLADLAEENRRASQLAAGNALTDMQRFDRAFAALLKDISNAPEQYVEMTLHGGKKTQARAGKQAKGVIMSGEEGSIPYNVTRKGLAALWPQRATFKAPGDMEVCTYNLSDFFAVLKYLETIDSKLGTPEACAPEPLKNCVLVIDEINWGNIAKIFGELMPDVSVRPTVAIDGVELPKLVEKLNQRIAYLFDRDHMLGHAYFILDSSVAQRVVAGGRSQLCLRIRQPEAAADHPAHSGCITRLPGSVATQPNNPGFFR